MNLPDGTPRLPCLKCGMRDHSAERCNAHLIPHLILHCDNKTKSRFERYVSEKRPGLSVVPSQKYERLVIVRADDAPPLTNIFESETALTVGSTAIVTQAVHDIWHDAIVNRYLHGVFPVTMRAHSLEHVMLGDFGGVTLRIAAWPKSLREQLLEGLIKNTTCVLDPKTCTHVLCVVDAYNRLHVGLMPNEDHYNHVNDLETKGSSSNSNSNSSGSSKEIISSSEDGSSTNEDSNSTHNKGKGVKTKDKGGDITRAAYKLTELMLNDAPLFTGVPTEGCKALDVGAAPGGWSWTLHEKLSASVVAVDPGALTPDLLALEGITHLRKQIEICAEELRTLGPFDVCVCDMNIDGRDAARLMVTECAPHLKPGAVLVLTLKTFNRAAANAVQRTSEEILVNSLLFEGAKTQWLFSNGQEKTLTATRTAVPYSGLNLEALALSPAAAAKQEAATKQIGDDSGENKLSVPNSKRQKRSSHPPQRKFEPMRSKLDPKYDGI